MGNQKAVSQIELLNYMKLKKYYKDPKRVQGTWIFRPRSFARVPSFDPFGQNAAFQQWDVYKFPKYNSTDGEYTSTCVTRLQANEQFEVTQFVPLIHHCADPSWGCIP